MDNAAAAAYATNPQLPPSLVVFSQSGDTLSDVLTMQRTFNPQLPKDFHLPGRFSYPGHLLQHLQPHQFLHPALDPRLTFGTHGAFRPLSAFAPPQAKSLKTGPDIRAGCSKSLYNLEVGHEASSPDLSSSPLNQQEDESMSGTEEANLRADTPGSERSTPEEGRGFRRRKQHRPDPACCPICGVTIRAGEFETHYMQEVERLMKMSLASKGAGPSNTQSPDFGPGSSESTVTGGTTAESRWETYQRVKNNRQNRLRSKHRSAKHHRRSDEVVCPVCNEAIHTIPGGNTVEQLNAHVEQCLLQKVKPRQTANNDVDADIDVEGDEDNGSFEEYEWAGQKRVRASSLLAGGYVGAGMQAGQSAEDEEGDLVVDGDDTVIYGPPQYNDNDVRMAAEGKRESSPGNKVEVKPEPSENLDDNKEAQNNPQIEALKMKIKQLESTASEENKLKCLICMDRYRKPVISINCWHVHCEDCWLQTLGAKKLCPQCNIITSSSDLRRIYL
ncbi:E3 ubiquitin-protein ligase RNF220-like isoform X1 [Cloeon dipterum]|uniref:E3 ubiquitin-protein ligase RNF220-like isoform X1 n=1 Tax=Cloeon dipterum TaxID=197152 RepID=UPI0032205DBA